MPSSETDAEAAAARQRAWKGRHEAQAAREFAAHQREQAGDQRRRAAAVREEAALIRLEGSRIRDEGARTRDDAARVRDQAALVRDLAARSRDEALQTRDAATRLRLARNPNLTREDWVALLDLDRAASKQSQEASARDREAAQLDRQAAEKDREAAERDRTAASSDRLAADKDRDAADQDRGAAEADRQAADADREESERDLGLAESRLARAERLGAVGRLTAGIAHELNNPLMTLMASLTMFEHEVLGAGSRELPALLTDARLAAERIGHIVQDLRAWVKGEPGHTATTTFDLRQVLEDSLRLTARDFDGHARVVASLAPLPPVAGVPQRMGQVFLNLLQNAAQAMPRGRAGNELRVRANAEGDSVWVELEDNGVGIAPEVLPHVFDPFFTTREVGGGTGLGLAVCERIVGDHGGTLTLKSTVGQGTTFRLTLPRADAKPAVPATPTPVPTGRHARLLLIDDDPALTRSLARMLSSRCDTTIAANGKEGLEALLGPGAPWDLVLCDVTMPVMGGVELHRELHAQHPGLADELVFISGGSIDEATEGYLSSLPNLRLAKPFGLEQLHALIAERLARQPAAP